MVLTTEFLTFLQVCITGDVTGTQAYETIVLVFHYTCVSANNCLHLENLFSLVDLCFQQSYIQSLAALSSLPLT